MKTFPALRAALCRTRSFLLAGSLLIPEMLPLVPVSAGVAASIVLILSTGEAEARYGTVRRPVRRTTRRVVRRTGRRVAYLGAGASLVYLDGMSYYYWSGAYYQRDGSGYVEVIFD